VSNRALRSHRPALATSHRTDAFVLLAAAASERGPAPPIASASAVSLSASAVERPGAGDRDRLLL